ncbi:BQ5605_C052g12594 [Microbotryum silenes-dioicae]|uniref:BQ5605_C052g12594 protein n=1 Tax=Microbotryum silenes-dioicae TaxID=796604 RepID=A0A2X0MPA8_9BASI|nr:BQ5605_C052g12594 [Microbotryum silenes-dioicae]
MINNLSLVYIATVRCDSTGSSCRATSRGSSSSPTSQLEAFVVSLLGPSASFGLGWLQDESMGANRRTRSRSTVAEPSRTFSAERSGRVGPPARALTGGQVLQLRAEQRLQHPRHGGVALNVEDQSNACSRFQGRTRRYALANPFPVAPAPTSSRRLPVCLGSKRANSTLAYSQSERGSNLDEASAVRLRMECERRSVASGLADRLRRQRLLSPTRCSKQKLYRCSCPYDGGTT